MRHRGTYTHKQTNNVMKMSKKIKKTVHYNLRLHLFSKPTYGTGTPDDYSECSVIQIYMNFVYPFSISLFFFFNTKIALILY